MAHKIILSKGHRYITVVVDHDTRRLIWAAPGRDKATLSEFFELLGPARCAAITHVFADAADWIADVVAQYCPTAVQCADPVSHCEVGNRGVGRGPPAGVEHRPRASPD